MNWTVEYDNSSQIIETCYTGKCSRDDFRAALDKRISLTKKFNSARSLIDASKLEVDEYTNFDVYESVIEKYDDMNESSDGRIALIVPRTSSKSQVNFYKTICACRGWEVLDFTDRNKAIIWLSGYRSSK